MLASMSRRAKVYKCEGNNTSHTCGTFHLQETCIFYEYLIRYFLNLFTSRCLGLEQAGSFPHFSWKIMLQHSSPCSIRTWRSSTSHFTWPLPAVNSAIKRIYLLWWLWLKSFCSNLQVVFSDQDYLEEDICQRYQIMKADYHESQIVIFVCRAGCLLDHILSHRHCRGPLGQSVKHRARKRRLNIGLHWDNLQT